MFRLCVAALAALVLLTGCGGGESDPASSPAGRAQKQFLEDLYDRRFDAAYATLHPAYQRVVSRKRFVACTRAARLGKVGSIEILDVSDDPIGMPDSGSVPAKAVRVRLTSPGGQTTTFVNHEVEVGSQWRWVLNAAAANAYKAGRCPGG
jgi:hypothetical protein